MFRYAAMNTSSLTPLHDVSRRCPRHPPRAVAIVVAAEVVAAAAAVEVAAAVVVTNRITTFECFPLDLVYLC